MKIKIKKNHIVYNFILIFWLLQIMCFTWLNITKYTNLILIIAMLGILVLSRKLANNIGMVVGSLVILYAVLNYFWCGGSTTVWISNILKIFPQLLVVLMGTYLMKYKADYLLEVFKNKILFWTINIYMVLNIPAILLEQRGAFWLSGRTNAVNTFVPDLMSGLFGFNGTPYLALFSALFFLYSYFYYKHSVLRYKKIYVAYVLTMLVFYTYISTQNDNKGFYIIFVIFIFIYYLTSVLSKKHYKSIMLQAFHVIRKFLPIMLILVFTVYFMYKYLDAFRDIVELMIVKINEGMQYNSVVGGGERFGIIFYALNGNVNKAVGEGIGKYYWQQEYAFGYSHYGISDMGTFLCLGGCILVILLLIFVYVNMEDVFQNFIVSISILIMVLFLMVYTQLFTASSATISLMLFLMLCSIQKENKKIKNM